MKRREYNNNKKKIATHSGAEANTQQIDGFSRLRTLFRVVLPYCYLAIPLQLSKKKKIPMDRSNQKT
jgi:hypothetical protein